MESYLQLVNPWLLTASTIMLTALALLHNITAITTLTLGLALLACRPYRTWITTQLCL